MSRCRHNRVCLYGLLSFVLLFSGCVSAAIVGSGKQHEYLRKDSTTMERVEARLGTPAWSRYYPNQVRIRESDEYLEYAKKSGGHGPFIWGTEEMAEDRWVSYCAVYTRTGPYEEVLRGQGYGMVGGMTLGVGDIVCLPFAITERIELSKNNFSLTMWFDENRQYVAVFEGDINNVASDFYSGDPPAEAQPNSIEDSQSPPIQSEVDSFWVYE